MNNKNYQRFPLLYLLIVVAAWGCRHTTQHFVIAGNDTEVSIIYDAKGVALDSIAAHLLARDIEKVTGRRPKVFTDLQKAKGNAIIIGEIQSDMIAGYIDTTRLSGKWEMYGYTFKSRPAGDIDQAMFVAGSDPRGTAYGVFDLSTKIGVSPWYWWADVPVARKDRLKISRQDTVSAEPSVKYRGIFLNDEDWGLQPWAAKTFEPSTGDIGPKTYAKIFELLLRLKANMIWPAMHPSTRAFFHYPGNPEMAKKWDIVIGSSHAEPMLRNNVDEWNHKTMGAFNYSTNARAVYDYWKQRVEQSRGLDAIYTMGMRGVHDSGMEGAQSMQDKVNLLEKVISDQRGLLKKYFNKDAT